MEPSGRDPLADAPADEAHPDLEHAHEDHGGHADLPGEDGCVAFGHIPLRRKECRTKHGQRDADGRRRVSAQWHGRDILASGAPGKPDRHHGVHDVAQQHA
jgi:hypothetical protein